MKILLVLAFAVVGCGGSTETTPESTADGDVSVNETEGTQIARPDASRPSSSSPYQA